MKDEEKKERELLKKILAGDQVAMKTFYTSYCGYLTTVCSRYIYDKNDVKDVLQESFIKIFNALSGFSYKGLGSIRAWATRIVVNESLKFLKAKEKLGNINMPSWEFPDIIDEDDSNFDEIPTQVLLEMIRSLPAGYRTVFNLYVFEKKSHKEIASLIDISENTSASQFHRAKSVLKKQIEAYKSTKKKSDERSLVRKFA